jgi:hypothetical protein
MMTPASLSTLMTELAAGDPPDLSGLSISGDDARALMATHLCSIDEDLAEAGVGLPERLEMMAAIAAHVLVENLVLNAGRLRRDATVAADFSEWLRRHRLDGAT